MGKKKQTPPNGPVMTRAPPIGMDLQTGFTKLVGNTATIAQHVSALKLVAKGVDVEPIEKANNENQNLLVALASFMNKMDLPGKPTNRAARRRAEKATKKAKKKKPKR